MRKWLIKMLGGVPEEELSATKKFMRAVNIENSAPKITGVPPQRLATIIDIHEKDEFLPEQQKDNDQDNTDK